MKPDFVHMSRPELKTYIRQHPTDDGAIRELFVNRRNPNARRYPSPYEMSAQDVEAIFREQLQRIGEEPEPPSD
ncbi:MAG: DUF6887 family protein [Spirulinaceae cyanobacterium]